MRQISLFLITILFIVFLTGCNLFSDSEEMEEGAGINGEGTDISERDGSQTETDEKVTVNDPNLLSALRNKLGKEEGDITAEDMLSIEEVNFSRSEIEDLSGMEFALNARFMDFKENSISDIEPLKNLERLERLVLDRNSVKDISAVSSMVSLEALELRENLIEDITVVNWGKLPNLVFLDIRYNLIDLNDPETERVLDTLYSAGATVYHDPVEPILEDW